MEVYSSRLSGKRVVLLDEREVYCEEKILNPWKRMMRDNFKFSFVLNGFRIRIEENGS